MSHEHRLYAQAADDCEHFLKVCTACFERPQRVLDTPRLRPRAFLEKILSAAADAMDFFGEIDDLKPGGKGADQIARRRGRPPLHARGKFDTGLRIPVATPDSADAVLFHKIEEGGATLLTQDLAYQRTQGVHILAQRGVLRRKKDLATVHDEPLILACAALQGALAAQY